MADERRQSQAQAAKIREMETQIATLQSQNRKLRKDFKKSILMLEQMKKRRSPTRGKWSIAPVVSLVHVREKSRVETPKRGRIKTRRRMVSRRGSSVEKYKQSFLAENSENSDHEKVTLKDQKWGKIRSELDQCKGLLRATNSEIRRESREGKENSEKGVNGQSQRMPASPCNQNKFEIGSLRDYQYTGSKLAESVNVEPNEPENKLCQSELPQLEVESISEKDLIDIFSNTKTQKSGYQKRKNPCYDDGLFEYLQQTGELTFN